MASSVLSALPPVGLHMPASVYTTVTSAFSGEPVWVFSLWRPCLVFCVFLAILFRFLEAFPEAPPAPAVGGPIAFTALYGSLLAYGGARSLARFTKGRLGVVERWQYALNLHQLLLNAWLCAALLMEVRALGMSVWGNVLDRSPRAYRLSWLVWVGYANRYLQGLDTVFLLLREKYVSVLHVFQQLALTWAWWLVCHLCCGGDAYFPALVQAAYNGISYGYFVIKRNKRPTLRAQKRITHVLMTMFVLLVRARPAPSCGVTIEGADGQLALAYRECTRSTCSGEATRRACSPSSISSSPAACSSCLATCGTTSI